MPPLLGIETEYAVTAFDNRKRPVPKELFMQLFLQKAREMYPSLEDLVTPYGLFFSNGSRLYWDHGFHPEMSTPECCGPTDVVRYILAGESMLQVLINKITQNPGIAEVRILKANIDYAGATWGCHESISTEVHPQHIFPHILPHLVSRIIITGSGGFDYQHPGLEFMISPRVSYLFHTISPDSTHSRGILHTKDEPLGRTGHRLHLLCGESLCSHLGMWLKVATTSLIIALTEAGLNPGEKVQLENPLEAMRTITKDISCSAGIPLKNGTMFSAMDIQRHYLDMAEKHKGDSFMPDWAEETVCLWRGILDRLEKGPNAVSDLLDWAIKLKIFKRYVSKQIGLDWESLAQWNNRIPNASGKDSIRRIQELREIALQDLHPPKENQKNSDPASSHPDVDVPEVKSIIKLRPVLFEMDLRFGQISPTGIFNQLDKAGVLKHTLHSEIHAEQAITNPPSGSRAFLRGQCVRKYSSSRDQLFCYWDQIVNRTANKILDLSDPYASEEVWREYSTKGTENETRLTNSLTMRRLGHTQAAARRLAAVMRQDFHR